MNKREIQFNPTHFEYIYNDSGKWILRRLYRTLKAEYVVHIIKPIHVYVYIYHILPSSMYPKETEREKERGFQNCFITRGQPSLTIEMHQHK